MYTEHMRYIKKRAHELVAGDVVGSGEIVVDSRRVNFHSTSVNMGARLHLSLQNPKTGKIRSANWGYWSTIGVEAK